MTVVILLLCAEFIAALGCGLAAGVFFAFSSFVMQGLKDLPAADGIKAMNAINNAAKKPSLMILLFGTALLCLVMMAAVFWLEGLPARADMDLVIGPIGGSVVYLVGAILVTLVRNIPLNNALAAATHADGPMIWKTYLHDWVKWNHVRTVACTLACTLLIAALVMQLAWIVVSR